MVLEGETRGREMPELVGVVGRDTGGAFLGDLILGLLVSVSRVTI
jgi:hypothetical protein